MSHIPDERKEARAEEFKRGLNAVDGLENRKEEAATLRKQTRQRKLREQRTRAAPEHVVQGVLEGLPSVSGVEGAPSISDPQLAELMVQSEELAHRVMSGDDMDALTKLRVLSGRSGYVVQDVFTSEAFLGRMKEIALAGDLQASDKALIILSNVTCVNKEALRAVVAFADPIGIAQTYVPNPHAPLTLKNSAIWLVSNIVGSGEQMQIRDSCADNGMGREAWVLIRDYYVENDVGEMIARNLYALKQQYEDAEFLPMEAVDVMQNSYWALSNFLKGEMLPDLTRMPITLAAMRQGVFEGALWEDVVLMSAWAIQYSARDPGRQRAILQDQELVNQLCLLCGCPDMSIVKAALRTIGELATYEPLPGEAGTELPLLCSAMNDADVYSALRNCIDVPHKVIRLEACFIVGNLAFTHWACVERLAQSGVLDVVLKKAREEVSEVKGEAVRAVCYLVHACVAQGSNQSALDYYCRLLHQERLFDMLAFGLKHFSYSVRETVLRAIYTIVKRGVALNQNEDFGFKTVCALLEESGARAVVEDMYITENMSDVHAVVEEVISLLEESELLLTTDVEEDFQFLTPACYPAASSWSLVPPAATGNAQPPVFDF